MNKELLNKYRAVTIILLAVVVFSIWFLSRSDVREIRNVVLISIDTCRADHLSCYGYKQKTTPHIDALAAEGILFENVVSACPMTLPSHSSMLTGTIPVYHGVHDNLGYRLAEFNITLAEILKDAGFTTGAAISAFVLDSQFGADQGFEVFDDRFKRPMESSHGEQRRGDETTEVCLNWLDENKDKRFFYFLHYYDPHTDYEPPEPFASTFSQNPYAGEIAYTDHCIGQVISRLKELDLYDSTLIIITSDHGEMLGEHGEASHTYFIYESAIKVPLILKIPSQSGGVRIKSPAGLIDIVPTVCSLLDIKPPTVAQGVDLTSFIGGKELSPDRGLYCESLRATTYGANSLLGIVTDRFKYIQTTRPELYDLIKDPAESNNLIHDQPHRARILKEQLARIIQESVRGDSADSRVALDDEALRRLESLGYVGGSVVEDFDFEGVDFDQTKDDPKDVLGYHVLIKNISGLIALKQYDRAEEIAAEMIRLRPNAVTSYQYAGEVAYQRGDHSRAVTYFQQALRIKPDFVDAHNSLGITFAKLGKLEQAIEHHQQSLRINPSHVKAHYNLGKAFSEQGKLGQAIEHYQQALRINPDYAEVYYNLGVMLAKMGEPTQAIEHYEKALRIKPDYVDAHNNLGITFAKLGKLEQSIEHHQQALRINPDHARVHNNLGVTLLRIGKIEQAIEHFRHALKSEPDFADARKHLSIALKHIDTPRRGDRSLPNDTEPDHSD